MQIPPSFSITPEMLDLVSEIDSYRHYFSALEIPGQFKQKIERVSSLKSSLYSARIEGNPLTMENFTQSSDTVRKLEIMNVSKALRFAQRGSIKGKKINLKLIQEIHRLILTGLRPDAGRLRTEMSAIFNQAGVAVYVPPNPKKVKEYLSELISYLNKKEPFPLVKSFIGHLVFEKIHPFVDGNGRVGRILILSVLHQNEYGFGFSIPFAEFLDEHKEDYYYYLGVGMNQTNEYLFFMLRAFLSQLKKLKNEIKVRPVDNIELLLPPRQE